MKRIVLVLFVGILLLGGSSCVKNKIKKPDHLIPEKKFIEMLTDIYLVKGLNLDYRFRDKYKDLSDDDLYYSVLQKYQVSDTVFISSITYYSSFPKKYEKMHNQIINVLSEKQMKLKGKEELNLGK